MQPKVSSAAYDFLTLLAYFGCSGQTLWAQITLLQKEQSDLSLRCFVNEVLKHFCRREKQTSFFVVIGALRVNSDNA